MHSTPVQTKCFHFSLGCAKDLKRSKTISDETQEFEWRHRRWVSRPQTVLQERNPLAVHSEHLSALVDRRGGELGRERVANDPDLHLDQRVGLILVSSAAANWKPRHPQKDHQRRRQAGALPRWKRHKQAVFLQGTQDCHIASLNAYEGKKRKATD